ncbi:MAG: prepilin-type N-terminal cleavage/methylation domain-containing protein, partial [candidate division WOR-3 bacterium]
MRKSKGFTLIELLIVVAILGILGSILFVSISGKPQARARDSKRIGDLSGLRLALELRYNEKGVYPTNAEGLAILQTEGYLGNVPIDPKTSPSCSGFSDGNYKYVLSSDGTKYILAACLEDTSNNVLSSDLDGTPTGQSWNCNDPVYCIGSM